MAYTLTSIEYDMYMKLPADIEVKGGTAETHVLKLLKNLFGGRQSGKVWADYLEMKLLQSKGLKIEDQDHPKNHVGVNIAKTDDGQYVFSQPFQINAIINDVGIGTKQRKSVPMSAHKLLHHHLNSPLHNSHYFNYRSVVGKLNYLTQISQPDICCAVHQCEKYSSSPHAYRSHYLLGRISQQYS